MFPGNKFFSTRIKKRCDKTGDACMCMWERRGKMQCCARDSGILRSVEDNIKMDLR
jgi:hypothetical protein